MHAKHLLLALPLLLAAGCGGSTDDGHGNGHDHEPVHAGALVIELGDHQAALEARLDSEEGALELWLWDAHLENAIRSGAESLEVELTVDEETFPLACAAQEDELTGETVGDSSFFRGQDDRLKGAEHVDGRLPSIQVKGLTYTDVEFCLPPEDDHDH